MSDPAMPPRDMQRWMERLDRQALRTASVRHPLYFRVGLDRARRVLDVGCGNGAVTRDLALLTEGDVVALDRDADMVSAAKATLANLPNATVRDGDAHALPFRDGEFDLAVCHLLLMWVEDPVRVVAEMARVVRPGGTVLAAMEPDYGGKMHWPENPVVDQVFQGDMIRRKGGDPHAGRKLRAWFVKAGLEPEIGLSNPRVPSCAEDLASYEVERGFYRKALLQNGLIEREIDAWEREYVDSLRSGEQFNFLPLFYALAAKR
jgi:ubiquinone/menaquinone biosynthesis C-methylase UbiE